MYLALDFSGNFQRRHSNFKKWQMRDLEKIYGQFLSKILHNFSLFVFPALFWFVTINQKQYYFMGESFYLAPRAVNIVCLLLRFLRIFPEREFRISVYIVM